jgi:anaerobic ribonucleoside-triphosphate reductase activating protein
MSLDTWRAPDVLTPIDALVERVDEWLDVADGLSISGGEPLEQASSLSRLLRVVRPRMKGDILLFTGHDPKALPEGSGDVLECIDTLIAGPFDETQRDDRPLIGSANQTIRFLTPLGRDRYALFAEGMRQRPAVDLVQDREGFWLAGVPRPGELERLSQFLETDGVALKTSAGRMGRSQ